MSQIPKNVAEKIYEHFSLFYTESFDLKKLSDEYAFHPTHIIRCVKNKYGLSPLQLLLHIRIQKAKELLTYTNFSINKVAISVGFDDNAYFTKQFKRIIGTTPTNYRKQQQINKI